MITVYVLESLEKKFRYIGMTADLERRLAEHRAGKTSACKLARFRLLHTEQFATYTDTRGREKFLKSGVGREWLNGAYPRSRPACGG